MNPTKEDILSPSAYKHLPRVRQMMADLAKKRDDLGAPFLKKKYRYLDGTWVLLHAMIGFNKIIMWGGEEIRHIYLSDGSNSRTYDYLLDQFFTVNVAYDGDLNPQGNSSVQFGANGVALYDKGYSGLEIENGQGEYLANVLNYESTILSDEDRIFLMEENVQTEILTGEHMPELGGTAYNHFSFGVRPDPDTVIWNKYDVGVIYNRSMANPVPTSHFRWTPSFFYGEPANGKWVTGWHYGAYGEQWYEGDRGSVLAANPVAGEAKLLSVLEVRTSDLQSNTYGFGYCEALTAINSSSVPVLPILSFFLSSGVYEDSGSEYYSYLSTVLLATAQMRAGTTPVGNPNRAFALYDPFGDGSVPDVKMWSFSCWTNGTGTADAVGIAIISGSSAKFYRYRGTLSLVYETEWFHSFSTTPDGTILSIFNESDGIISEIRVFDLYGTKVDPLSDVTLERTQAQYSSGGFTDVRTNTSVADLELTTACMIPVRQTDFEPSESLDKTSTEIVKPDGNYWPAMGSIVFSRDGEGGVLSNKLIIEGGVNGKAITVLKTCLTDPIYVDNPSAPPATNHFLSKWGTGAGPDPLFHGYLRGSFTGSDDDGQNSSFVGEGIGGIATIEMPKELVLINDIFGFYSVERYSGELIPGSCLEFAGEPGSNMVLSEDCRAEACGGGDRTISVASTCGQTYSSEIKGSEIPPLVITGPEGKIDGDWWTGSGSEPPSVGVGEYGTATGGVSPYTWSATGLTIDEDSGEILAIPSGTCDASLTVTDDCGNTDTKSIAVNSGFWELVSSYVLNDGGCCPDVPCSDSDLWPYVPFSEIPIAEQPFGINWTCGPSTCYMNVGGSWITNRTQTSKRIIFFLAATCPDFTNYLAETISEYVWSC
jgi:hypothetical protein